MKAEIETWLKELTPNNDRFLSMARQYIDSLDEEPAVGETSRNLDSSPQKPKSTSKAQSSVSKKSSAVASSQSKTSSQRKTELLLAKMRRDEIEKKKRSCLASPRNEESLSAFRVGGEQ